MIKALALPLSIIACILVFFFYISPTHDETQRIKETEIPELEKKIKEEEEITKNINSLTEDYSLHKEELKKLKYVLPEDEDVKSILVQLEALLLANGMAYEEIGVGSESVSGSGFVQMLAPGVNSAIGFSAPSPIPVVVSLNLKGSYGNLKKFITELEVLDRICNVTSLKIKGEETNGNIPVAGGGADSVTTEISETLPDPDLELAMTLEFYSQKPISKEDITKAFNSFQGLAVGAGVPSGMGGAMPMTTPGNVQ